MTTDDVIARLEQFSGDCNRQRSRLGYFAVVYKKVTEHVKAGIAQGRFEDGPRMERLDVIFAGRYFDALDASGAGQPVSGSWRLAFAAAERTNLIALQHLLLSMNAHIGLDLGVAAAEVAPGPAIASLRRDFDAINQILLDVLGSVQKAIGSISPSIRLLDTVNGRADDELAAFGLVTARQLAWKNAEALAAMDDDTRSNAIGTLDTAVELAGSLILAPGPLARAAVQTIWLTEEKDPCKVMQALALS